MYIYIYIYTHQALFMALLKQPVLSSVRQVCRWLAILNSALTLMLTLFPDATLYSELRWAVGTSV